MSTLSVIIITRNEEHNLVRALESVKFADEIVLFDSYSTDKTLDIAKRYCCKIHQGRFEGYGAAKQRVLDLASCEWVLSIDADEEVDDELKAQIKWAVENGTADGYYVNRLPRFLGRWIRHSGWYPDYLLRLFRREIGSFTDDIVHESVAPIENTGRLKGHLLHYTTDNLREYVAKIERYSALSAKALQQRGRKFTILDLFVKPPFAFVATYVLRAGFLDGVRGLILAFLSSYRAFVKYARLWELQKRDQ